MEACLHGLGSASSDAGSTESGHGMVDYLSKYGYDRTLTGVWAAFVHLIWRGGRHAWDQLCRRRLFHHGWWHKNSAIAQGVEKKTYEAAAHFTRDEPLGWNRHSCLRHTSHNYFTFSRELSLSCQSVRGFQHDWISLNHRFASPDERRGSCEYGNVFQLAVSNCSIWLLRDKRVHIKRTRFTASRPNKWEVWVDWIRNGLLHEQSWHVDLCAGSLSPARTSLDNTLPATKLLKVAPRETGQFWSFNVLE